jgi:hypothetical protein
MMGVMKMDTWLLGDVEDCSKEIHKSAKKLCMKQKHSSSKLDLLYSVIISIVVLSEHGTAATISHTLPCYRNILPLTTVLLRSNRYRRRRRC